MGSATGYSIIHEMLWNIISNQNKVIVLYLISRVKSRQVSFFLKTAQSAFIAHIYRIISHCFRSLNQLMNLYTDWIVCSDQINGAHTTSGPNTVVALLPRTNERSLERWTVKDGH